jgi:hypothetical protein
VGEVQQLSEEFRTEALKVEELLKQGDYAGGAFHAQWMLAEQVKLNYEYAVLQAQLAQTYAGLGRIEDALVAAGKATTRIDSRPEFLQVLEAPPRNWPSKYLLPKDWIVGLLALRMRLLAAQGLALEALQAYYELAGLEQLRPGDPRTALAVRLTEHIQGPGILRGKVQIGPLKVWRQYLSRRKFSLENVQGNIHTMTISCVASKRSIAYQPGEIWTVPENWGLCVVFITAEPDTSFEFVEFPDAK